MSAAMTAPITERKPERANPSRPTRRNVRSPESQEVTHDQIATLAYALWELRGRPYGSPDLDWSEAEQQLLGSSADRSA